MSIRVKLLLTYGILLLLSAIIVLTSGLAIVAGIFHDVASTVLKDERLERAIPLSIELLAELKQAEDYHPENLKDPEFIEAIASQITFIQGGLIVRTQEETFNFSQLPKDQAFYSYLVPTKDLDHSEDSNFFTFDDKRYFYVDYEFRVGNETLVYYFIADMTKSKLMTRSSGTFFRVVGGVLLLMMVPLLWIVTQDIIKPIRQLEAGVKQINEGNLDYVMASTKQNELGQVIRYFDAMRITLKTSIERQVAMEENRKELVSSISHDLKTPITSIKGYVEGILDGVANTPQKQDDYLKVIHQKSKDLDALIDQLFLFSKLDLNKLPYTFEPVAIGPYLEGIVEEMRLGWENDSHRLQLVSEVDPALMVVLDRGHMKRVLVNLIQNSMRYSDKAMMRIDVVVKEAKDDIEICVLDNGMGIGKEALNQIFQRFYRVDASRNSEAGGTGLGLAIAKQIVEHHGGTIHATSTPGEGTSMCIRLNKQEYEGINHV